MSIAHKLRKKNCQQAAGKNAVRFHIITNILPLNKENIIDSLKFHYLCIVPLYNLNRHS